MMTTTGIRVKTEIIRLARNRGRNFWKPSKSPFHEGPWPSTDRSATIMIPPSIGPVMAKATSPPKKGTMLAAIMTPI
ncbi:MAG: hypothetical protein HQK87_03820 [Nitrospinae bacterium]|nr:hypothetical protein [Nitrospinota bacterium]